MKEEKRNPKSLQKEFFRVQVILTVLLALLLGIAAVAISTHTDHTRRDQNLQNVAQAVARSQLLTGEQTDRQSLREQIDSLKAAMSGIDVISVVDQNQLRLYHSNTSLIGTVYDGTLPVFSEHPSPIYAEYSRGPSGTQRRVYAPIYGADGSYRGFVMAVALMTSIRAETWHIILTCALMTGLVLLIALGVSSLLSKRIRQTLNGYEPDVFSAMFKIRESILESLSEGVVAVDALGRVQFQNSAAQKMLADASWENDILGLFKTLKHGTTDHGAQTQQADILVDRIPITENGKTVGALAILHDRAEYTRLMEDLSGTRYLVDSMRANNHDFTNKLHVILGLLQMELYEEAQQYIEQITILRQESLSAIMKAFDEPSVAALLIGKNARAAELNVRFRFQEGSCYRKGDISIQPSALVTILGNLIDNALDAMNRAPVGKERTLTLGLFTRPGALLLRVEDTGSGIAEEDQRRIFENGFTTKGDGHGTGLYQVKRLVEQLGGTVAVESREGVGSSFLIRMQEEGEHV